LKGMKLGNWPRATPAGLAAATVVGAAVVGAAGGVVGAAAGFAVADGGAAVGAVGAVDEHAARSGNVIASALVRSNVRRLSAFIPFFPPRSSMRRACYTCAMPTYRVLYTDRGDYSNNFDIERSFYDPIDAEIVDARLDHNAIDWDLYERLLSDADALVCFRMPVDRRAVSAAPKLKVAVRSGVGYENFDLGAFAERGIPACKCRTTAARKSLYMRCRRCWPCGDAWCSSIGRCARATGVASRLACLCGG